MLRIHEETCHSCKFATRTVKYIRTKYDDVICCINEECSKGGCHGLWNKDEIENLQKHHPGFYAQCPLWKDKNDERKN